MSECKICGEEFYGVGSRDAHFEHEQDCELSRLQTALTKAEARAEKAEAERDAMRNCANCGEGDRTGARQICVGCHGYKDVSPEQKKTYLINWTPRKEEK